MAGSEVLSAVQTISEYLYPYSPTVKNSAVKNFRRLQLRELYKKPSDLVEEIELSSKLLDWLKNLDRNDKNKVLTHKNPIISSLLFEMHMINTQKGSHVFKVLSNPIKSVSKSQSKPLFISEKRQLSDLTHPNIETEKLLESSLMFCDKESYLDCISVDPDLNVSDLIRIIKTLSNNKGFLVPCRIFWDSFSNLWCWEYPAWFTVGNFYSLACIACASLERAVWIQYWSTHNLDPRHPNELMAYKKEEETTGHSISELSSFLDLIGTTKKAEIIGDYPKHIEIYNQVEAVFIDKTPNNSETEIFQNNLIFNVLPCLPGLKSHKMIENISEKLQAASYKLVEFLFFTPLKRICTSLDIVARKVLISVIMAFSDKKAEDLITEIPENSKSEKNQLKKTKKNKNKKNKNKTKKIDTEDFKDISYEILNKIIDTVVKNYENSLIDIKKLNKNHPNKLAPNINSYTIPNPTKTYQIENKKKFNSTSSYKKQTKRPHSHKYLVKTSGSIQSPPKILTSLSSAEITPKKPEKISSKFQWSNTASEPKLSNLDNSEFPPLSSTHPQIQSFSSLHNEIIRFCTTVSKKVKEKYIKFSENLQDIISIINKLHPDALTGIYGSYGSGLALESSDIDLVINLFILPSRPEIQESCKKLCIALEQSSIVLNCQAITTAKIPVVKVKTSAYFIDITYQDETHSHQGLSAVEFTLKLLYNYPALKELSLVLKNLLFVHNLNSSYHGGINSYSLLIWITGYLNSIEYIEKDLGTLLMKFLDFYGNAFDPVTTGINIINTGCYYTLPHCCYENVVTIDPLSFQNITSNSFLVSEIKLCFASCYARLKELTEKPNSKNLLKQIFKSNN